MKVINSSNHKYNNQQTKLVIKYSQGLVIDQIKQQINIHLIVYKNGAYLHLETII